jgi:transposase
MFIDLEKVKIFIHPGITDMRKAVNGLSVIVTDDMELDPLSESLFIFCNRDKKLIKALYWDRNGFCLWQKRLEKDKFPWPVSKEEAEELNFSQLKMLFDGIDFWKAHKPLIFEEIN